MAQPFTATWRISYHYTFNGLSHVLRQFVKIDNSAASPPTIFDRNGASINWTAASDGLIGACANLFPSGGVLGTMYLEQYDGVSWNPIDSHSGSTTSSGTVQQGWQVTYVIRDQTFDKLKVVFMEGNTSGLAHASSLAGLAGNNLAFAKEWTPSFVVSNAPYMWAVSRSEDYCKVDGFVGFTLTTNRRTRRARGLV